MGPYVYMAWFGVLIAAFIVAVIHLVRKRFRGVVLALSVTFGALLSWALVSAYIGVCEIDGYAGSRAFVASLAVGIVGVALFVLSCMKLK